MRGLRNCTATRTTVVQIAASAGRMPLFWCTGNSVFPQRFLEIEVLAIDSSALRVNAGFCSRTGKRPHNQDYVGVCCDVRLERAAQGQVVALADGVSSGNGGRVAAELTVRGFVDGLYSSPPTAGVARNAAAIMQALNGWLHTQAHSDPLLRHASTTFTAIVLQGRTAHVVHVGDTRAYLLHDGQLTRLTQDHTLDHPDLNHVLSRAVGMEPALRLDHRRQSLRVHDRLMVCSDGVHGALRDDDLRALLLRRRSPTEDAEHIVAAALDAGSQDNASCIIVDVLAVPEADAPELLSHYAALPIVPAPAPGDVLDGFVIDGLLAQGRYSRLLLATDSADGRRVVLKFPQPSVASASTYHLAFVREAWVAARLQSPYIAQMIELPVERQTRLYSVMPYYEGETLEQRLQRRPQLLLAEGVGIALRLAKAVTVLHRAGIIHRDIKPENVLLTSDGGLRLIDLGVVRLPRIEEFPAGDIPGTPSFMAPELFAGEPGSETSDLFALGVTLYRMFSGRYPYGEIEPFTRPRFGAPVPLSRYRPDLPAWLEHVLARMLEADPAARFADVMEVVLELESSMARGEQRVLRRVSLHDRNPLRFWKCLCALLALALLTSIAFHVLGSA